MDLRERSFLKEPDFTPEESGFPPRLSAELKAARHAGTERPRLRGGNIALIFDQPTPRTRCAFEVAAHDQGAHVTYLDPAGSQLGREESVRDTARVLGGCSTASSAGSVFESPRSIVFESLRSIVFDQAENRPHTIKAVMVATLGG